MPRPPARPAVVVLSLLAVLALLQFAPSVATGQSPAGPARTPVPGGPGHVMVPAAAFIPASPDLTTPSYSGGYLSTDSGNASYVAPVYLPDRAHVTKMTMYFWDTDPGKVVGTHLLKYDLCGATWDEMAAVSSDGSTSSAAVAAASTAFINYADINLSCGAYTLAASVPPSVNSLRLYAVRIDYAFTTALPAVVR